MRPGNATAMTVEYSDPAATNGWPCEVMCKTIIQSPVALCKIYTFGDTSNGIKIKMNLAHFPSDDKSWIVVGWEAFP
jgi:hypothetical protein